MIIYGTFKDRDNNTVSVDIYNIDKTGNDINIDNCDWIRFGSNPVTIKTDCSDSFTHIIKKTCKIELLTRRWLGDYLFANNATSIVVNVSRTVNNTTECLFAGYVTPCTFNQNYANAWETIQINCIDNIGVLKYRQQTDDKTWTRLKAESQMRTFKYLLNMMHLRDTDYIVNNMPQSGGNNNTIWVETGFDTVIDATTGAVEYYAVETSVRPLDSYTAVTTTETQTGTSPLTVTYVQSDEVTMQNGLPYYKKYAYVTINGEQVNTGDWILGDLATEVIPTVVDTVNTLDGWTYGPMVQPFEYYEHYRIDNLMSDGSIAYGSSDTIGEQIPETPSTTTNGSYWEFRQGSIDDLDEDVGPHDTVIYYYKNYAWIIMTIDGQTREYKTGDWVRGNVCNIYAEEQIQINEEP